MITIQDTMTRHPQRDGESPDGYVRRMHSTARREAMDHASGLLNNDGIIDGETLMAVLNDILAVLGSLHREV